MYFSQILSRSLSKNSLRDRAHLGPAPVWVGTDVHAAALKTEVVVLREAHEVVDDDGDGLEAVPVLLRLPHIEAFGDFDGAVAPLALFLGVRDDPEVVAKLGPLPRPQEERSMDLRHHVCHHYRSTNVN